ncbi:MAG: hypothetical protein ACOC2N_07500, partial [Spirochaetota bacterium]
AIMDGIVVDLDGSRVDPGGAGRSQLYAENGLLRLGTVTVATGETQFEVVAVDIAGNEGSWSVSLSAAEATVAPTGDE